MNKRKFVKPNLISPLELRQRSTKTLMLSSRQLGWNGILVEQCQYSPSPNEARSPAISDHRLILPLGPPAPLIQKRDNRLHESILQKGDSIFIPAGYSGSWRCPTKELDRPPKRQLHIWLKPETIAQAAEAFEIDIDRLDLLNNFGQRDSQLHHIAMLLLAELQSDGIMGQLYVESLTQVLVIHLLRHYSTYTQPITSENRNLSDTRLQQAIDYIHAHLDRDLSLVEIARVINISPTYFASLFKRATGVTLHKYVVQQRVEKAKSLLLKTDLAIADIALQVGFSNQSHLTRHFKCLARITPKQFRLYRKNVINHDKSSLEVVGVADNDRVTIQQIEALLDVVLMDILMPVIALFEGLIALDSTLYLERSPIESICYEEILKPGSLIRIEGAKWMGKTSLVNRILEQGNLQAQKTVYLDFDTVEWEIIQDLNKLLLWLSTITSHQLDLKNRIQNYWSKSTSSCNDNCTAYFENYILTRVKSGIVLALDNIDRLFYSPEIAEALLGMLCDWHEKAKDNNCFSNLKIVTTQSTRVNISFGTNRFFFNTVTPILLEEFDFNRVRILANFYQLDWNDWETLQLFNQVGGNPYLIRLAMYQAKLKNLALRH